MVNVNLDVNKTLILNGVFTGQAGITTKSMTPGTQFGRVTEDGLDSIENLIADSGALLASYDENNNLVWRSFKNELSQPSTDGEKTGITPTLKGVTEPNAKVTIKIVSATDPSLIITEEVDADENGNWELPINKALETGEYTITVTANKNKTHSDPVTRHFEVVDKSELQTRTEQIKSENLLAEDYTIDSWDKLQQALQQADTVLKDPAATQEQVTAALTALNEAYGGLEKVSSKIDKTKLQAKVNEIQDADLAAGDYTTDSWDKLQQALQQADTVLKDPAATQEQVTAALTALNEAFGGLEKVSSKIDKTKLQAKVNEIQDADLAAGDYTTDSWDKLQQALQQADTVLKNPDATQEQVNNALQALENAQNGLKAPKPTSVTLTQTVTEGNKVILTFNQEVELTDLTGFTVMVDGEPVIATFDVDPTDNKKVIFTLPNDTGVTNEVKVIYNGAGNLKGKATGAPVENFEMVAEDPYSAKLQITQPTMSTIPTSKPIFGGTVATNTTPSIVNVVLTDAANNQFTGQVTVNPTTGEWIFTPDNVLPDGTYTLTVTATDGIQTATKTKTFTISTHSVVGKGLSSLTPSTGGSLSPSFQTDVTNYTMSVGYSTDVLSFDAIPVEAGATVTTTVNGKPGTIGQIPLQVGENIIIITVKDANGNVRHYTIKVYREAYTGGGNTGDGGTTKPTPTPSETTTKIQVALEIDGDNPLEKTKVEIERTKHANGEITDLVALTEANAKEAVEKAKQIGNNIARIVIPDVNDEVDQVTVEVPKQSLQILRENGLTLEISTENGHIAIPHSSMEGVDNNFYFRLVPVKKESERKAIEERAKVEKVVRETLQSDDVHVIARPMTIETNMPSRPVQVTLPLKGVNVPSAAAERQAFLDQLAVFIEHSDGEKKVVRPEIVTMNDGKQGLRFTVDKFSTFTIIQFEKPEVSEHKAYIKGFPNGTFGPDKNVTRAQVAIMIARLLGYTEDQTVNQAPFKDVAKDHSAAGEIAFVKQQGIMNGDNKGLFHANANITRAEMAAVVANFKQLSVDQGVTITFNDTKGHWAQWIIEANRTAGIINGFEDGSFAPNAPLTRAQAVVMMNRMFERGPLNGVTAPSFPDVKATHWAFKDIEEAANSHSYLVDKEGNEQFTK
ncbi:S-layer homology domain-containing protein [Heyndrickxia oleronia]|uniref:S-layer homology domain-containing protein n=1 Tax=Heyndrickxia oleronia TaxID=38875 RepID=UPI003751481F